jgi:cytochrome c-type biogenesis protein
MEWHYLAGFAAGVLSLLAPCVLPIIPLIVYSVLRGSRWAPALTALGLALSFALFGILTSTFSEIFDPAVIRNVGALVLIFAGALFLIPQFKEWLSLKASFIANAGNRWQGKLNQNKSWTPFVGGMLLGMIWSPCSGPTLAFAVGLATQAGGWTQSALIFFAFGAGAGLGLVSLGALLSRVSGLQEKLLKSSHSINLALGVISIVFGLLILSGQMGNLEELLLSVMPEFLVELSVKL